MAVGSAGKRRARLDSMCYTLSTSTSIPIVIRKDIYTSIYGIIPIFKFSIWAITRSKENN